MSPLAHCCCAIMTALCVLCCCFQADMTRFGIGASTALFGVLASVMWIQIRFIGIILTFVFTLICHEEVWIATWEHR